MTGSCHILQTFLLITPFPHFKDTYPDALYFAKGSPSSTLSGFIAPSSRPIYVIMSLIMVVYVHLKMLGLQPQVLPVRLLHIIVALLTVS